jgi:hypothetical protein
MVKKLTLLQKCNTFFKKELNYFCKKMKCNGGFFWMIPAAIGGAVAGAVKHGQNVKEYKKNINQRNRRRTYAAFTGDMPSENAPERPSAVSGILGGALGGINIGQGIQNAINLQGLIQNKSFNPYTMMRENSTYNPQMPESLYSIMYPQGGTYQQAANKAFNPYPLLAMGGM